MSKLFFYAVLVLLLVAAFFGLNRYIYQEKQGDEATFASYACSDGRSLVGRFSGEQLVLFLGDDRVLTLEKASANEGPRYADDSGNIFSTKEKNASFEEGGVATYANCMLATGRESFEKGDELWTRYTDGEVGFMFEYRERPEGYFLQEPRGQTEHANFVKSLVLVGKREYEELLKSSSGREGPPTITTLVFRNPGSLRPGAWAEANPGISNIALRRGDITETTIAGAPAVRYAADGLYLSDNVIVTDSSRVYVISGSYLEENSRIREDFEPFLASIAFTPSPNPAFRDGEYLGFIHAVGGSAGGSAYIEFDDAVWLTGVAGEDAAIAAGLCTEETRDECLPNDYFIQNATVLDETLPLDAKALVSMQTWGAEEDGVMEKEISLSDFGSLINDSALHWSKLPYTITIEGGEVSRIKEVYIP